MLTRKVSKNAGYDLRKQKKKNHNKSGETQQYDCGLALARTAAHPTVDLIKTCS
ncbi:MAG: hypothetical protein ACLPND_03065 [Candidatus Korobacteraceae bacterium]